MSDFLTRVSRAALGLTPVLQVLGTSRYEPGPNLRTDESGFVEEWEASPQTHAKHVSAVAGASSAKPASIAGHIGDPGVANGIPAEHEPIAPSFSPSLNQRNLPSPVFTSHVDVPVDAQPTNRMTDALRGDSNGQLNRSDASDSLAKRGLISSKNHSERLLAPDERPSPADDPQVQSNEHAEAIFSPSTPVRALSTLEIADWAGAPDVRSSSRPAIAAESQPAVYDRRQRPSAPSHGDHSLNLRSSELDAAERAVSITRRPNRLPLHDRPDPEPSSPPVIRVTIGRIEVRAPAPPPPPVEAPAPPRPRISLDDYLQSHNGRSR
jgi:hypothetical protein